MAEETELLSQAAIDAGWRLACRQIVTEATTLALPENVHAAQGKTVTGDITTCCPWAKRRTVPLPPPAGDRSLVERLEQALGARLHTPAAVLARLPGCPEDEPQVTASTVGRHLVQLECGSVREGPFGLALDLGTSTVAAYLLELEGGTEIGSRAAQNQQAAFGADILSRIAYAQQGSDSSRQELRAAAQTTVNELIEALLGEADLKAEHVVQAVVVGNPTMLHLLVGANVASLGQAPFAPLWQRWLTLKAVDLGLTLNPAARVALLPSISGYVGADVVAGLLACGVHETERPTLYLDLGTNGEIVLACSTHMVACSAAAGPAFEAVGISCGMPALEGAVDHVEIDHEVHCSTIGGDEPRGLCGTGLTDAVAELLRNGILDPSGRMTPPGGELTAHVEGEGNERRFMLTRGRHPVYVSQADVRKLQLAKAALRSAVEVLLEEAGITAQELHNVHLAGAFGAQMKPESLVRIGLLPEALADRVQAAGNAAGQGAKAVLADVRQARAARRLARRVAYLELASHSGFARRYVQAMHFPKQQEVQV